jgi:hypothetical protein
VDVDTGLAPEEAQVLLNLSVVLSAADALRDFFVEGLYADFKLERAWRELADQLAQSLGQAIGDHLEVQEQAGHVALQEELEDSAADVEVEVEGAIHELEMANAALEE